MPSFLYLRSPRLVGVVLACGLVAGCGTRPPPRFAAPALPVQLSLKFKPPPVGVRAPAARQPLFDWVVGEFYPAGARPVAPRINIVPELITTPAAQFPSQEECVSPNEEYDLHHLAVRSSDGLEYVVFLRYRKTASSRAVFQLRKVVEVLWAPDNRFAAITVLTGSNNAEVVLFRVRDLRITDPIPVEPALRDYFSLYLIQAPQFITAHGWTTSGKLLLRARGSEPLAPFGRFGYEVLVDPERLEEHDGVRFLRGYDSAPNSAR